MLPRCHVFWHVALSIVLTLNIIPYQWCSVLIFIPYHTIPYYTIPYHAIPYHTMPHHTILYYTIPYHTMPHHTIPYHTILFHTTPYNTIQYNTIQYNTIQYNTIQYNTIQYNTIQYNTDLFRVWSPSLPSQWARVKNARLKKNHDIKLHYNSCLLSQGRDRAISSFEHFLDHDGKTLKIRF